MLRHAAILALGLGAAAENFTASCNDDATLTIDIPFDREAEVLELNYGSCDKSSDGVTIDAQNTDFSFHITLDLASCEMDSTLRAIELAQQADVRIGRSSVEIGTDVVHELTFATFDINSFCSVTDTYEVVFDYGNLTVHSETFTESAGEVNLTFAIQAYDDSFTNPDNSHSTTAGELIYLGITIVSAFNYAEREFAPETCTIHDTLNNFQYTMFHNSVTGGCSNPDIELVIGYDDQTNMWQMTHVLFLLGDFDESTFLLKCTMKVCTIADDSECDEIRRECALPVIQPIFEASFDVGFDGPKTRALFGDALGAVTAGVNAAVASALTSAVGASGVTASIASSDVSQVDADTYSGSYQVELQDVATRKRRDAEAVAKQFIEETFLETLLPWIIFALNDDVLLSADLFVAGDVFINGYIGLVSSDSSGSASGDSASGDSDDGASDDSDDGPTCVPVCGACVPNVDCLGAEDENGSNYSGEHNVVLFSGATCIPWNDEDLLYDDYDYLADLDFHPSEAKCANPDDDPRGPWCFVHGSGRWEHCDIPRCDGCASDRSNRAQVNKGPKYGKN